MNSLQIFNIKEIQDIINDYKLEIEKFEAKIAWERANNQANNINQEEFENTFGPCSKRYKTYSMLSEHNNF